MPHTLGNVLYSGMEQQFEQFLEPSELHSLSLTSKLTRETGPNAKFRTILKFLMDRSEIIREYPLRTLVKHITQEQPQYAPYTISQLYDVAEYMWNSYNLDTYTFMLMRAEVGQLGEVENVIADLYHICRYMVQETDNDNELYPEFTANLEEAGYDNTLIEAAAEDDFSFSLVTNNLINFFAERFAVHYFQYVVEYIEDERYDLIEFSPEYCYPLSAEIRDIVVSRFPIEVETEIKDKYGYGLSEMLLVDNLALAIKFQDYDLFKEYASQYFNNVDEVYLKELFKMKYDDFESIPNVYLELVNKFGGYKH